MAQSESRISGISERYARSLFELAVDAGQLADVEADLDRFDALIAGSGDLQRLIKSPVFAAGEQLAAITALSAKAKIGGLVGNFLKVVARNRRLFAVPGMIAAYRALAAEHRGEINADVTAARELTAAQMKELRATLKGIIGKDASINMTLDPSILGGLIVRVGSRQIDTSLKTKLNSLKLALKEVG